MRSLIVFMLVIIIVFMLVLYHGFYANTATNQTNNECIILTDAMYSCYINNNIEKTGNSVFDDTCSMYNIIGNADKQSGDVVEENVFKKTLLKLCRKQQKGE